jgi:CRISPR-associated protein Cmr5
MNKQETLEQARAKHAWEAIQEAKRIAGNNSSEYGSLVRRASALIRTNGLGQTLAFYAAKGKGPHQWLKECISQWVLSQVSPGGQSQDLLDWIMSQATSTQYRWATQEALAYLRWLRRFAEAELLSEKHQQ